MLQGRIDHHGHHVGHIHVGRLGQNLDLAQLEPETSNCFSGQAIRLLPAAHDLVPRNLIPRLDNELGRISQVSLAPLVEAPTAYNSIVGGSILQKGFQVADNAVKESLLVPALQEHDDAGFQRLVHSGRVRGQLDDSDLRVRDGAMAAKVVHNQVDMMRGARLNRRHELLFEPALEDRSVSPSQFLREVRQRARVALALEAHPLSCLASHRDRHLVVTRRVAAESQGDTVLALPRLRATCSSAVLEGHV